MGDAHFMSRLWRYWPSSGAGPEIATGTVSVVRDGRTFVMDDKREVQSPRLKRPAAQEGHFALVESQAVSVNDRGSVIYVNFSKRW
ncbi:MAG: hypothetical protein JO237_08225 [Pseudolabrys sp.]|nr:hypothetical protein [Pseudolabrys sp.]